MPFCKEQPSPPFLGINSPPLAWKEGALITMPRELQQGLAGKASPLSSGQQMLPIHSALCNLNVHHMGRGVIKRGPPICYSTIKRNKIPNPTAAETGPENIYAKANPDTKDRTLSNSVDMNYPE